MHRSVCGAGSLNEEVQLGTSNLSGCVNVNVNVWKSFLLRVVHCLRCRGWKRPGRGKRETAAEASFFWYFDGLNWLMTRVKDNILQWLPRRISQDMIPVICVQPSCTPVISQNNKWLNCRKQKKRPITVFTLWLLRCRVASNFLMSRSRLSFRALLIVWSPLIKQQERRWIGVMTYSSNSREGLVLTHNLFFDRGKKEKIQSSYNWK